MPKIITIEDAKRTFEEKGCLLLDDNYINSITKMKYRCVCGNIAYKNLSNMKQGQLCYECGRKRGGNRKYNIDKVRDIFRENACVLKESEYVNPKTRMRYKCKCGRDAEINLDNFLSGKRCQGCRVDKLFGMKDDEYRKRQYKKRKSPEYRAWRLKVLERDSGTCICCGELNSQMNVHHIESFSRRPDMALEVSNGVTMCEDCHREYHSSFYYADADEETFREFMYGEYREPSYAGEAIE